MIRAGNYTVEDNGFATSVERIGGSNRECIVLELPAGISDQELEAICTGPIEVLGGDGDVVQAHTGPFLVASHSIKLLRQNVSSDVAMLTAKVSKLEAELVQARSAEKSANTALASLKERLSALQAEKDTTEGGGSAGNEESGDEDNGSVLGNLVGGLKGKLTGNGEATGDAADSVQE